MYKNRFGFMPKRSTMKAIFSLAQLMKKKLDEEKKNLYMVFITLEKVVLLVLDKECPNRLYVFIKDMHEGQ